MLDSVERQLASLPSLDRQQLNQVWQQLFGSEPNLRVRKSLMVRFIAYRIQQQGHGGLGKRAVQRLEQLASSLARPKTELFTVSQIRAGTRLVRQWRDQVHVVHVEEENFEYRGRRYESLSEIARLITGTRWSGPVFFGLKQNQHRTEAHQ